MESGPAVSEIEFRSVSVARGGRAILTAVDLAVQQGETMALVGRSGAGKSTILKLVNRLLTPDEGEVFVSGDRVTRVPTQAATTIAIGREKRGADDRLVVMIGSSSRLRGDLCLIRGPLVND